MATYRIYPSATPAGGGNADNYVWLGVEFYVTSACNLDAILWYQPASGTTNTQNRKGYLYQGDSLIGTVVAGPTAIAAPSGTGWQRLALTPSYALTPNTRYRAVIGHPNGGYPADANYFSSGPGGSGITNGPLVVPSAAAAQGNDQNVFTYDSADPPGYPNDSFNAGGYWVDVEVSDGSSTTPVSSDSDLRWRVMNRVTADHDFRWRVSSQVTSDPDLRWRVMNRVSSDLDARWATAGSVSADHDLRWAIQAPVTSDLDARWRSLQSLSTALDARWAVRGTAVGSLTLRWAVEGFLEPVSAAGAMDVRTRPRTEHVTRVSGPVHVTRLGP